jgi:N-acetylglucosaminyl-diphospho-decaprenol L-rhamnosyltransferase
MIRVVCVVYGPGEELRTFVASLAAATTLPYELVLVDNGDPRPIAAELSQADNVVYLPSETNLGYGAAINRGAAHPGRPTTGAIADFMGFPSHPSAQSLGRDRFQGGYSWLVAANPDIEWLPGSLDALVAAARRHPRAGSLGPRVLDLAGGVYPSARPVPSLVFGSGHALLGRIWPGNPFSAHYKPIDLACSLRTRPVGWLSGACLLLRPEAFAAVGGFDERYFMFFEDTDLGDRLGRAGWENLYVPGASVIHDQGASWKTRPAAMLHAHHASARRFFNDHHPALCQAPLRGVIGAGLFVRERIEVAMSKLPRKPPGGSGPQRPR